MPLYLLYLTHISWWRHQMETFSALLAICAGNSPVSGEFPAQRPVTRSFDLRLNKRLSKQSWGWWFETLSCPLWRQCNVAQLLTHAGVIFMLLLNRCVSVLRRVNTHWKYPFTKKMFLNACRNKYFYGKRLSPNNLLIEGTLLQVINWQITLLVFRTMILCWNFAISPVIFLASVDPHKILQDSWHLELRRIRHV